MTTYATTLPEIAEIQVTTPVTVVVGRFGAGASGGGGGGGGVGGGDPSLIGQLWPRQQQGA